MANWSIEESRALYNIAHWSSGFFDIDEEGDLVVYPQRVKTNGIKLNDIVAQSTAQGLSLPLLLRFDNILQQRILDLQAAFHQAIDNLEYQGQYLPVYPIKVNQQRQVVETIRQASITVGLEAGSKPELLAILGLAHDQQQLIVCNGYKDQEYLQLAMIAQQLGHHVYLILEKQSELPAILAQAKQFKLKPRLGVRVRLSSRGSSKWQASSGEHAKFGLTASQILQVIQQLREQQQLDQLQLIHFHMGSQITNIHDIQMCMHECARYYAELRDLGAPIHTVDVGGGLGVDYDGTRTRNMCSTNYSIVEYANNIVTTLFDMCEEHELPHPNIITETGRALTAHHAVLVTDIINYEQKMPPFDQAPLEPDEAYHIVLHNLYEGLFEFGEKSIPEIYHQTCHWFKEAQILYIHGVIDLAQLAYAEQLYRLSCMKVRNNLVLKSKPHREIFDEINLKLADKLFCNFSIFQSTPDVWAIDQIFPIMPLSQLNQAPTHRGIIEDITCDSDGQIASYVDGAGIENSLPLPTFDPNKPYALGLFLIGAYQEILGDLHNLFGDTNAVHIQVTDTGEVTLSQPSCGDTIAQVLRYVQFDPDQLLASYQQQLHRSDLDATTQQHYLQILQQGLTGYTYLSSQKNTTGASHDHS
ncbi:MAG: biosynthetic arginine decarboxylase [Legionellales bacterium]|nr:biosynthetic arginine decarboxylase [Legionellales bacterium]